MMHKVMYVLLGCLLLAGCGVKDTASEKTALSSQETTHQTESQTSQSSKKEKEETMQLTIDNTKVSVTWESNDAVAALKALCANTPLVIDLSMYGGFEQVGDIGHTLPRNDKQTKTQSGDIVLYAGDQIVIFYGSNSWAYTRLGHITDKSAKEMRQLLSKGDVTITLSAQ